MTEGEAMKEDEEEIRREVDDQSNESKRRGGRWDLHFEDRSTMPYCAEVGIVFTSYTTRSLLVKIFRNSNK